MKTVTTVFTCDLCNTEIERGETHIGAAGLPEPVVRAPYTTLVFGSSHVCPGCSEPFRALFHEKYAARRAPAPDDLNTDNLRTKPLPT